MRIRTQNLFIILFGALFCMLTVTGFAFSPPPPSVDPPGTVIDDPCYPGSALDSIPSFTQPADEGWNRWQTGALIVTQGSPYHMVHDLIVKAGDNQEIVGKFDYGAVFHKDLEYEDIHVYIYGTGQSDWQYLGRYTTNGDGKIYADIPQKGLGEYIIKMVVAGDLTEAIGYMTVVNPGRKAVVFDIDGTLTTHDFELVGDYANISTANEYAYSVDLVHLYKSKGYQVIFLTARAYWMARDTREWYDIKGYSTTTITHFSLDNSTATGAEGYKTDYLNYLQDSAGIDIIRAYGNASSDIAAYENAGIPKSDSYIIGSEAGNSGTMPLYDDYEDHYNWLSGVIDCN